MTWQEALEARVARTSHARYRALCADDHPDHEAWRARMIAAEGGEPTPPAPPAEARPPVAESLDLARRMRACPFRSTDPGCGCSGGRCALRRGAVVSHLDCFDCLRRFL